MELPASYRAATGAGQPRRLVSVSMTHANCAQSCLALSAVIVALTFPVARNAECAGAATLSAPVATDAALLPVFLALPTADSVVTVTDSDTGKEIDLAAGQTLRVKLPATPSTGYSWLLSGDPAPLKLTRSFYERNKNTSGMPGSPQDAVFELRARRAGVATLTFVYRRAWEYNVAPARTFTIRVKVG